MVHNEQKQSPLHLVWLIGGIWLALFSALRLGLLFWNGTEAVGPNLWFWVLGKGLIFDLIVLSAVLAPVLAYEALLPNRWRKARWHRALRVLWFITTVFVMIFGVAAEVTFWLEFSTRFNFIAVDYLLYTHEVIGNIRQSYPVPALLGAFALVAALIYWGTHRKLHRANLLELTRKQRVAMLVASVTVPVVTLSLSNVDQIQGSGNAFADEMAGNGLFTLAAAMRRNELDYDKFYQTISQEKANSVLQALHVERQPLGEVLHELDEDEAEDVVPMARSPKNIVLISVESLSADFLGTYGNTKGLTPNMDRLAKEGLLFTQLYATGTRTVRGLEALSLGTPPVPGQAIVRRPNNEHLSTIGEVLHPQGVQPYFFYGGYGYFDNMNAYFAGNTYKVIDRTDIPKEKVMFENVWGVADEVIFNHVIDTLAQRKDGNQPFFAHIMTTSNHRPYTYPSGRIDIPSPGGRDGAVKYTDYAIGDFINKARQQPWFKDTLFVITADHCASVAGKTKLPVQGYHIPMIFYAPELVKPGQFTHLVSQIDIPPTLVEVMGKRGDGHFFGRSFFEHGEKLERAFISNYQALGYLRDQTLTVLMPKGKVESYAVNPKTFETTPAPVNEQHKLEAIAYYQTASRAFKAGQLKPQVHSAHP